MTATLLTTALPTGPVARSVEPVRRQVELIGRGAELDRLLGLCASPQIEFVAVTGPMEVGRSALLSAAWAALTDAGVTARLLRLVPSSRRQMSSAVRRLAEALNSVTQEKRCGDQAAVLIDDLQAADHTSLTMMERLVRAAAKQSITVVGAIRTPVAHTSLAGFATVWRRGREDRNMAAIRLQPLAPEAVGVMVATELGAVPTAELLRIVDEQAAGVPGAVHAVLDAWRGRDNLRYQGSQVGLADASAPVCLEPGHPFLKAIGGLDTTERLVLAAAATLHPIGDWMPPVIATATGRSTDWVVRCLTDIAATGIIHRPCLSGSWRFHPPVAAAAARSSIGPYRQAQLSSYAVMSLQETVATAAEVDMLTHYLAAAGGLIDGERAYRRLVEHARTIVDTKPECAARWTHVATRSTRRSTRMEAFRINAWANLLLRNYCEAARSARQALVCRANLTYVSVEELETIIMLSASALGEYDQLDSLVGDSISVGRLTAFALAGNWPAVIALSADVNSHVSKVDGMVARTASAVAGTTEGTAWLFADRIHRKPSLAELSLVAGRLPLLLMLGEYDRARELLDRNASDVPLTMMVRALVDKRRSLDQLGGAIAGYSGAGLLSARLGDAVHARETAMVLVGTGRIRRASELIGTSQSVLTNIILSPLRVDISSIMGESSAAVLSLEQSLLDADKAGIAIGTDELLLRTIQHRSRHHDERDVMRWLDRLNAIASSTQATRACMNAAKAQFLVRRGVDAATEVARIARQLDQPYECMRALIFLAECGHIQSAMVAEAYQLAGDLGALLWRARLRALMRWNRITVPDRERIRGENEELLHVMVSEGLTNREMASCILVSGKSIEDRLGRMFKRYGYRSRVDVATGFLAGSGSRQVS